MSYGVGHRRGLDTAMQWLWCKLVTTALIGPLDWEPPYATSAALKDKKTKKKKKKGRDIPFLLIFILKSQPNWGKVALALRYRQIFPKFRMNFASRPAFLIANCINNGVKYHHRFHLDKLQVPSETFSNDFFTFLKDRIPRNLFLSIDEVSLIQTDHCQQCLHTQGLARENVKIHAWPRSAHYKEWWGV